jgi:hypothetical protein
MDTVAAPGQHLKAKSRGSRVYRFRQDATAASYDRVGGQDKGTGMPQHHNPRFLLGKAHRVSRRQLAGARHLVDFRRIDPVGLYPDLPKQIEPARRGRSEHKKRCCRHSVTPAGAARKSG